MTMAASPGYLIYPTFSIAPNLRQFGAPAKRGPPQRERVEKAQRRHNAPRRLERLEVDLHGEVVLSCANRQLRDAIERNALPLLATHSTSALIQDDEEIETMFAEHHAIYDFLLAGEKRAAMAALEAHIRRSLEPNIERLKRIGSMPKALLPPFLIQTGATRG